MSNCLARASIRMPAREYPVMLGLFWARTLSVPAHGTISSHAVLLGCVSQDRTESSTAGEGSLDLHEEDPFLGRPAGRSQAGPLGCRIGFHVAK